LSVATSRSRTSPPATSACSTTAVANGALASASASSTSASSSGPSARTGAHQKVGVCVYLYMGSSLISPQGHLQLTPPALLCSALSRLWVLVSEEENEVQCAGGLMYACDNKLVRPLESSAAGLSKQGPSCGPSLCARHGTARPQRHRKESCQ
jgi:hypothetical protein